MNENVYAFDVQMSLTEHGTPVLASRHWQPCVAEGPGFSQATPSFKWLREEQKAKEQRGRWALKRHRREGRGAAVAWMKIHQDRHSRAALWT